MKRKITFFDSGQDFLWWVLDEMGVVIDCGPFQGFVWVGCTVDIETLDEGCALSLITKRGDQLDLIHIVESIEIIE